MTPESIARIKSQLRRVSRDAAPLAAALLRRAVQAAPNLRPLFPGDLTSLQGHFEAALALVVRNLDEMSALRESLRDLGGSTSTGARVRKIT